MRGPPKYRKPATAPLFPAGSVLLVGGPADGRVVHAGNRRTIRLIRKGIPLDYDRDPKVPTTAVYRERG